MIDSNLDNQFDPKFTVTRSTKLSRFGTVAGILVVMVLAVGPLWLGRADMRLLVEIFYFLALSQRFHLGPQLRIIQING